MMSIAQINAASLSTAAAGAGGVGFGGDIGAGVVGNAISQRDRSVYMLSLDPFGHDTPRSPLFGNRQINNGNDNTSTNNNISNTHNTININHNTININQVYTNHNTINIHDANAFTRSDSTSSDTIITESSDNNAMMTDVTDGAESSTYNTSDTTNNNTPAAFESLSGFASASTSITGSVSGSVGSSSIASSLKAKRGEKPNRASIFEGENADENGNGEGDGMDHEAIERGEGGESLRFNVSAIYFRFRFVVDLHSRSHRLAIALRPNCNLFACA
jgi:hypothetical protein